MLLYAASFLSLARLSSSRSPLLRERFRAKPSTLPFVFSLSLFLSFLHFYNFMMLALDILIIALYSILFYFTLFHFIWVCSLALYCIIFYMISFIPLLWNVLSHCPEARWGIINILINQSISLVASCCYFVILFYLKKNFYYVLSVLCLFHFILLSLIFYMFYLLYDFLYVFLIA